MASPDPVLVMAEHYAKNVALLATVLLAGGSGLTVVSAHLLLAEANDLAEASLERLESEIQRAITQNLTITQVTSLLGDPQAQAPQREAQPAEIGAAARSLRAAAQVWRDNASTGDFQDMNRHLKAGYLALRLPPPAEVDFTPVHGWTGMLGSGWPVPERAGWMAGSALVVALLAMLMDAHVRVSLERLEGAPPQAPGQGQPRFGALWARSHLRGRRG